MLARVVAARSLMAAGALAIAFSSAPMREHLHWQAAAEREARRYGLDPGWVEARLAGEDPDARRGAAAARSTGLLVAAATAAFLAAARSRRRRPSPFRPDAALALAAASLALLVWCALALWRTTRFG